MEDFLIIKSGVEVGMVHWGDHLDYPPTNYLEFCYMEEKENFLAETEEFIRGLIFLCSLKEKTIGLQRFQCPCFTGKPTTSENIPDILRLPSEDLRFFQIGNLSFSKTEFRSFIFWLGQIPSWNNEHHRPLRLNDSEKNEFTKLMQEYQ